MQNFELHDELRLETYKRKVSTLKESDPELALMIAYQLSDIHHMRSIAEAARPLAARVKLPKHKPYEKGWGLRNYTIYLAQFQVSFRLLCQAVMAKGWLA